MFSSMYVDRSARTVKNALEGGVSPVWASHKTELKAKLKSLRRQHHEVHTYVSLLVAIENKPFGSLANSEDPDQTAPTGAV